MRWIKLLVLFTLLLLVLPGFAPRSSRAEQSTSPLIQLQYASFDPLAGEPFIPDGQRLAVEDRGPATYIVQFSGPVDVQWKEAVEQAGASLYGYIPEHAFIARMDSAVLERVNALPFIHWIGPYHPAYRLAGPLRDTASLSQAASVEVVIQMLPGASLDELQARLLTWKGVVQAQIENPDGGYVRASLPPERLNELAAMDSVLWVEPYLEPKLFNDTGGGVVMKADSVRSSLGLYGAGQIVAVADSGLDTGNTATLHPDVAGRLLQAIALGRVGDWSDYVGHGTHVVGSVLGNGKVDGSNPTAHQYAGTYSGVAPEAQLVMQSLADAWGGLGGIPLDQGQLMRDAYTLGARLHTNSWGSSSAGAYTSGSRQVDQAAWEKKDMLVLFAAGNDGVDVDKNGVVDPDSMGSPGTAKNVLTVGASENNRTSIPYAWGSSYGAPISTDLRANNISGMAAFSSRGPTDDGRVKPDITAPGTWVASMRTRKYVFNDNLEGSTSGYTPDYAVNGGTGSNAWSLQTDSPHSPTHYWKETVSGSFNNGAVTFLLTPPMDVRPTGGVFDVQFWHKYSLSTGDGLVLVVFDANDLSNYVGFILPESGALSTYVLRQELFFLDDFGVYPSAVRIGFGIQSDGSSTSTWWLDDIRVDGSDWGTLSSVGLTTAGSTVDDAYLLMGGTSMATPLTAGAAALTREWLVKKRGLTSPSAALMKAVLVNGAADMSPGQYGTSTTREIPAQRPNNVTGWGRVDLEASLNPPAPRQVWLRDNTAGFTTSGATTTYTFTVGWLADVTATPGLPQISNLDSSKILEARPVELKVDGMPESAPGASLPLEPQATVTLALDDGDHEYNLGLTSGGYSYQFIWLNRFTPAASEFPFSLQEIRVMFDGTGGVSVGQAIDLAVYQDTDGNPANGATLLGVVHETIKAVDGTTWSVYTLASPIQVSGPGDVLIAVINRFVQDGVSPASYPAALDGTTVLNRSWVGWWLDIPPDPPVLPTDSTFEVITAPYSGNWLIRGYGTTGSTPPPPPPAGSPLRVTLAWTDYPGTLAALKTLVNDLDLEVIAPGGTHYYGNAGLYTSGQCLRGQWDACNNVEGVVIGAAAEGVYTVIVRAYQISNGPQPFALVASGDNLLGSASPPRGIFLPVLMK